MLITNLGFASYLIFKGYKLSGKSNRDTDGKFLFPFDDINKDDHDELLLEYTQSDFCKFDAITVNLKRSLPRY